MSDIAYRLPSSVWQAFSEIYFHGVNYEVCETFASRWGGLDRDAFQRAFTEGQGKDKCVAIFVLGTNATPEIVSGLQAILSSSNAPRLERWASAITLARMKFLQAYPLIETLLLDGLSSDEYTYASQNSDTQLSNELWWCGNKRTELITLMSEWSSSSFIQILRQLLMIAWRAEKTLYPDPIKIGIANYDVLSYTLGIHGAFGALVGLEFPPAYWKTAIVYMALGALHAQPSPGRDLERELYVNLTWQESVAEILGRQFGLVKEEQDDCIHNLLHYSSTRRPESPVEQSKEEHKSEDFYNDDEEEEEEEEIEEKNYGVSISRIHLYSGHTAHITSLSWSPDGTYVVSGSTDGIVQIWESLTGKTRLMFNEHRQSINAVAWSPQGDLIASGGNDRVVRVWDARTGEQVWEGIGHSAWIWKLAWAPDGTRIASASLDKTVRVWDISRKKLQHILRGHEAVVTSVTWSPDGKHLVSGSGYPECLIFVWNAITGERELVNQWHTQDENKVRPLPRWVKEESLAEDYQKAGSIDYLSWSPDRKWVVSAGERFICCVWDAKTGKSIMATSRTYGPVFWSSDSNTLLWLPYNDRTVEAWDVKKNALKAIYQLNTKMSVNTFCVSPTGKYIAADDDTQIGIWELR